MSLKPIGKLLIVSDPPEENTGLVLPDGAKGPEVGIVAKTGDEVVGFNPGDKVFYRGGTIDIFTQVLEGETAKRITTKLISVEQIVAVEETD